MKEFYSLKEIAAMVGIQVSRLKGYRANPFTWRSKDKGLGLPQPDVKWNGKNYISSRLLSAWLCARYQAGRKTGKLEPIEAMVLSTRV